MLVVTLEDHQRKDVAGWDLLVMTALELRSGDILLTEIAPIEIAKVGHSVEQTVGLTGTFAEGFCVLEGPMLVTAWRRRT